MCTSIYTKPSVCTQSFGDTVSEPVQNLTLQSKNDTVLKFTLKWTQKTQCGLAGSTVEVKDFFEGPVGITILHQDGIKIPRTGWRSDMYFLPISN